MLRVVLAVLLFAVASVTPVLAKATHSEAKRSGQPLQAQVLPVITLKDGTRIQFLKGIEADVGGAKALLAAFKLENQALLADHARLIEIADTLFGGVVMVPAEVRAYKRAVVGFLISQSAAGDTVAEEYEDFHYKRGDDAVWLRQAGTEAWKKAQDPNDWKAPVPEIVDLGEYGKVEVPYFGEIMPPPGRKKALGVELYTPTRAKTGRKVEEIRAFWDYLDHDKLKADGFDAVLIQNYEERARGKFHVRQMAYAALLLMPDGNWPPLPQGPLGPDGKPLVTAENAADSAFAAAMAALGGSTPVAQPRAVEASTTSGTGLAVQALGQPSWASAHKRGARR